MKRVIVKGQIHCIALLKLNFSTNADSVIQYSGRLDVFLNEVNPRHLSAKFSHQCSRCTADAAPQIKDRSVPGHGEGDLILGKYTRSALDALAEWTTRYTILVPLGAQKDAVTVRKAYAEAFQSIPAKIKKTLTYDQGKEMSEHQQFMFNTHIAVYFAHPDAPWERRTNENTNGLIRQYIPKGTDFTTVPVKAIKEVQRSLNDQPRVVFDYLKPDEVLNKLVALNI